MKAVALLLLGVLGTAMAARTLEEAGYPVLDEYSPSYNVLNITGWEDYPEGCWAFPLPAINVVLEDGVVYLLSTKADASDASGGQTVAQAWCEYNGFDGVGKFEVRAFSEGQMARTVEISSATTCEGVGLPAGAGLSNGCTAFQYIECVKGGATTDCSKRFTTNQGVDNRGYQNIGSTNIGNFNNGSTNVGDYTFLGSANVGSFITGSANWGDCVTGDAVKAEFRQCELMSAK